jgi:DNA-binding NarL/FixJ family response regulator
MKGKKILIVDDDQTTASVMQLYVSNLGYEVVGTAADGKTAINMCRELAPDLLLMDIYLGKGLDGIDSAEIIHKHFKIPIVFVSAYADENTLKRAKAVNPMGYVNKPLRETDLKTSIEFALAKSGIENEPPQNRQFKAGTSVEDVLISLYSLTRSEARFMAKLVEYPELNVVAAALNISLSTAKTHLKRIYKKTDTNRQSVLVHKIVTGPAGFLLQRNTTINPPEGSRNRG